LIGIGDPPPTHAGDRTILVPLVQHGEFDDPEPLAQARQRHARSRAELPPTAAQMSRGEPVIPTVYTNGR
jgi:nicotinate phosphoribosyltransferase